MQACRVCAAVQLSGGDTSAAMILLTAVSSSLFETILFALVKEIRFGRSQVDYFTTAFSILSQLDAFTTVVRVSDPGIAAYHTATGQAAVVALVANVHWDFGIDHAAAYHTQAVAWK